MFRCECDTDADGFVAIEGDTVSTEAAGGRLTVHHRPTHVCTRCDKRVAAPHQNMFCPCGWKARWQPLT